MATYFPEDGYTGPDLFTFSAFDGLTDSNLGTISVNVGNAATFATRDNDADGLSDFVEYALGLSPDFPSATTASTPVFETVSGQNYLSLSIPRTLAPGDVTLTIEVSSDLTTWQPATIMTNTPSLLKARDPLPVNGAAHRFIRLKATR